MRDNDLNIQNSKTNNFNLSQKDQDFLLKLLDEVFSVRYTSTIIQNVLDAPTRRHLRDLRDRLIDSGTGVLWNR